MNLKELKKSGMIIYDAVGGSHAYSLNNPQSDRDERGIFIYPNEVYLELEDPVPQISDEKQDATYYSLKRFFELIKTANPNLIEMLWYPRDCVSFCAPVMQKLINSRDLFISKKAHYTHASYAYSQISKASGAEKMINHPEMFDKPLKENFCWIIPLSVANNVPWYASSNQPCRPISIKDYAPNDYKELLSHCHVAALEHVPNTYRVYYYGKEAKGVFRGDDMLVCESIPMQDEEKKFYGLLIYNHNEYEKALQQHRKYKEWMENRNESRWIDQENKKVSYDAKNMMHCMRLLISGENILTHGFPLVRFEGEQRDYLMSIRRGEFKYDELMEEVERRMAKLEELYETSSIPHSVNIPKIEKLYRELINE